MGTLYIVPTPIGNLEDMTLRGLRVLKEVDLIAAEDTRTSRVLLDHYEIKTPLTSYHEHNKLNKLDSIFDALARGDVALISDAGTPGISDPGYELIREAISRDILVVPLPGANAVITAVVGSGLPADSFVYLGFLPKKQSARRELLQSLKSEKRTLVAYESPHRLEDTLGQIRAILGDDRPVCVGRELTKRYETYVRGPAEDVHQHFIEENPKGEVTLVIGGAPGGVIWSKDVVLAELERRTDAGESLSRAAKAIAAESGWKKSNVYALGVED